MDKNNIPWTFISDISLMTRMTIQDKKTHNTTN